MASASSCGVTAAFSHPSTKRRLSPVSFLLMRPGLMERRSSRENQEVLVGPSADGLTGDERGTAGGILYNISILVRCCPLARSSSGRTGASRRRADDRTKLLDIITKLDLTAAVSAA